MLCYRKPKVAFVGLSLVLNVLAMPFFTQWEFGNRWIERQGESDKHIPNGIWWQWKHNAFIKGAKIIPLSAPSYKIVETFDGTNYISIVAGVKDLQGQRTLYAYLQTKSSAITVKSLSHYFDDIVQRSYVVHHRDIRTLEEDLLTKGISFFEIRTRKEPENPKGSGF